MACTIRSAGSIEGSIVRGIALCSMHDIKDKRSAAAISDRRIRSNEINHVVATAFFEFLYRVSSRNSRLRRLLTVSCSVLRRSDRYSEMEICLTLRYAAACAMAKGKNVSSVNSSVIFCWSWKHLFLNQRLLQKRLCFSLIHLLHFDDFIARQ